MRNKVRTVIADSSGNLMELADLAEMTRQTFSKYVKLMIREGLVEYVKRPEDFRITGLSLTEKGLRARELDAEVQEKFNELVSLRGTVD